VEEEKEKDEKEKKRESFFSVSVLLSTTVVVLVGTNMFHKEGSCVEIISPSSSSSNSNGGGGNNNNKGKGIKKGKQQQQSRKKKDLNETIATKVVDIPLRKSDRRKLRQRAAAYFLRHNDVDDSREEEENEEEEEEIVGSSNNIDQEENKTTVVTTLSSQQQQQREQQREQQQFEQLLDDIFIKGGTVSSRSMPLKTSTKVTTISNTKGNHESMILYVKSGDGTDDANDGNDSSSSSLWPYNRKHQFIWMAIEDKKSNTVLKETPTVAVLAVLFHLNLTLSPAVLSPSPYYSHRMVTIPSPASKYLCRGADLMRAGIISAPLPTTAVAVAAAVAVSMSAAQTASKKSNKNKKKKNDDSSFHHEGGNEMVVICVKGNPQPFAVGRSVLHEKTMTTTMTMTEDTNQPAYGYGTKGVGIEIWNCYGDDLWRTTACGSSTTPPSLSSTTHDSSTPAVNIDDGRYGNPGFMESTATTSNSNNGELYVVPIISHKDEDNDDDDDDDEDAITQVDSDSDLNSDSRQKQAAEQGTDENNKNDDDDSNNADKEKEKKRTTTDDTTEQTEKTGKDGDATDSEEEQEMEEKEDEEEEEEPSPPPPSKTPDELFHDIVCQSLVNLTKNELPMLVGTFYTKFVRPATNNIVDIKTTTYQKFGNYLKKWQQQFIGTTNDDNYYYGLLHTGPDPSNTNNKDPNAMLLSFNRRHDDLQGLKKMKHPGTDGSDSTTNNSKIVLVSLYTIPTHWTDLLRLNIEDVKATHASSEVRKGTGMLTLPEIRKILDEYLQREELVVPKSSTVVLDGPLTDALYKKKKKNSNKTQQQHQEEDGYPEKVSRKELSKQFFSKLGQAYALVKMPGSKIIKLCFGIPPKIEIEVIRRQTKKYKTYVRGLEEYNIISPIDEESKTKFCKDITKRLAVSGSIDTDPHSNGRGALAKKGYVEYVFGANIVDELEALFTGDESLSDHGGVKHGQKGWDYPRIPLSVIEVTLRKGVPVRKQAKQRRKQ